MTEAAEGGTSQLQVKGFAAVKGAVCMMNMGYTGCLWSHTQTRREQTGESGEDTHHLLHTSLELKVYIKVVRGPGTCAGKLQAVDRGP